jgi:hypothetical protein
MRVLQHTYAVITAGDCWVKVLKSDCVCTDVRKSVLLGSFSVAESRLSLQSNGR